MNIPTKIFISYSHKDKLWKDRLVTHLEVLKSEGIIELWIDSYISAGKNWNKEIQQAMEEADIAILLVSANSLTSKFILRKEIASLLRRRYQQNLTIFPIIIRPCAWRQVEWLAKMQVRPYDGQPLSEGTETQQDVKLTDIVEEIAELVRKRSGLHVRLNGDRISSAEDDTHRLTLNGREFVYVPSGPFIMGTTQTRVQELNKIDSSNVFDRELPAHELYLPGFYIARYPVTNEEYQSFLEVSNRPIPFRDDPFSEPYNWDPDKRTYPEGKADCPVVLVSWEDALAYCHWVDGRLPTEAEWEKAARGNDSRVWPWGNNWRDACCNSEEFESNGTTPVKFFSPRGDSPYGVGDMAGNVWEWCSSMPDPYPYCINDGREANIIPTKRILRGGSFGLGRHKVRCAFRNSTKSDDLGFTIGFRVVLAHKPEI